MSGNINSIIEIIKIIITGAVGIAGALLGAHFNNRFAKQREIEKKAVLEFFSKPILHKLQCSVRAYLGVKYIEGELPVFNATSYLTIETEVNGRRSREIPKEILVKKESFCLQTLEHLKDRLRIVKDRACYFRRCIFCSSKTYLVPYHSPEVEWEALPWTLPVDVGAGLEGDKYNHVTHIPVGGNAKLAVFDVYRVKVIESEYEEEFYLVKVHSEYGCDIRPRICLKLPLRNSVNVIFKIRIGGENLRETPESPELKIEYKNGDYYLSYGCFSKSFSDILKDRLSTIDLRSIV